MSAFADLDAIGPQDIWNGVAVRAVHGEQITLGVVELEPNSVVPEHRHENEQLGIVLSGSLTFRIGDEARELGPGGTWCIRANTPHEAFELLKVHLTEHHLMPATPQEMKAPGIAKTRS